MAEPLEQNPGLPAAPSPVGTFPGELKTTPEPVYSSLSLTALIGFSIAALYAVALGLMAIYGLFNRAPLLLSLWTALVPLSAILLCLLARGYIRSAEGTLAGESLVRWGLLLSLFTALGYWSYYAAVYIAIRQQAQAYIETWMDQLRDGDTTRGAMGVMPPLKRLGLRESDANLPAEVEHRLSALEPAGKPVNAFKKFSQFPLVRLLVQGGKEMKAELRAVSSWSYVRGGYEVSFLYDLETPEGTYETTITAHGLTAPGDEYERRQWYVDMKQTRLGAGDMPIRTTDQGRNVNRLIDSGREFAMRWLREMPVPESEQAFLLSLPSAERKKSEAELDKIVPLASFTGPLGATLALPEGRSLEKFTQFLDGGLVVVDSGRLRTPDKDQLAIIDETRKLFTAGMNPRQLMLERAAPLRKRAGDRLRFSLDAQLALPGSSLVECVFEIECAANALESPTVEPDWQFIGLRIVGVRKAPAK